TAVKIDPAFRRGSTTYVVEASRAVGVVSCLLSKTERAKNEAATRDEYIRIREQYARGQEVKARATLAQARENRFRIDPSQPLPGKPSFIGVKSFDAWDLQDLADHIDWTPFFASWELIGRYPLILDDEIVGEAARDLFEDAKVMLKRIIDEKWFTAKGVVGFWPARADGDDVIVFADESRNEEIARFHTLRQQIKKSNGKPNLALSDFIAEEGDDYIGAFAVTAGHGELEVAKRFKDAGDDYSSILATSLADRLAEAFAERLHKEVRTQLWGYAADEVTGIDDLITEQYQGIRPAPGYPAQPDHTEKATLFRLLQAEDNAGMALTESYAMTPPASVSGLYFGHPGSHYFGVGKIDLDQVEDYARRKGWDVATAERWLAPILNYDPYAVKRETAA
ncbi:MAG: vitamin B12 dependent-methionine synthase activation domain-containing protein, partial [Brevundimonas sp.]|uniref:vitamin B12 dependent-methionine synthase activation domain-containing protein n=1 Tax=Brevundimonas sp. TaxID=1871086 RepID=UPI00271B8EDE